MGALHRGHIELLKRSVSECDKNICSIFVNPIQFNNPEDLKKYPRDFEKDAEKLKENGCDLIFYPSEQEIYPEKPTEVFDFGTLDKTMEGAFRPGHFNGVAIVVKRLLELVQPQYAYFGQKDFQQLAIVNKLVNQEKIPVRIRKVNTVREKDGLAMSSRNLRLTKKERNIAPLIYLTLKNAKNMFNGSNEQDVKQFVTSEINKNGMMKIEYFDIVYADDLTSYNHLNPKKQAQELVGCIAVNLGKVRLIDNIVFNA